MEKKLQKSKIQKAEISKEPATKEKGLAISWQAPEFEYNPKDVSWYWLSLIVAIILLAFSLWQKNFLFAIFTVIGWFIVVNWASRYPTIWEFKIDDKGINIKLPSQEKVNKFYAHSEIKGFDIWEGNEKYKELILRMKSRFSPYLRISLPPGDEEKIKKFLLKFLPQEEYGDSVADSLSKLIRF